MFNVTVTVENTGGVAGATVVSMFYTKPLSTFVRYHKMLAVFAKTPVIPAGSSYDVTLSMPASKLSSYNLQLMSQAVEAGHYILTIGEDSATERAVLNLTVH